MQLSTPMIAPSDTLMNLTGRYNGLQPLPYYIAKKFQVPIFTVATVSNRPSLVLAKRAINFGPTHLLHGCVLCLDRQARAPTLRDGDLGGDPH